MAKEVLTSIDRWFIDSIYTPLRTSTDPAKGIADMFAAVDDYFRSGQRVALRSLSMTDERPTNSRR
jgi:hypothetical protein